MNFVIKTRKKSRKPFWEAGGCGSPALAPEAAAVAWKQTPSQLPRASFQDGWLDGEETRQACPVLSTAVRMCLSWLQEHCSGNQSQPIKREIGGRGELGHIKTHSLTRSASYLFLSVLLVAHSRAAWEALKGSSWMVTFTIDP